MKLPPILSKFERCTLVIKRAQKSVIHLIKLLVRVFFVFNHLLAQKLHDTSPTLVKSEHRTTNTPPTWFNFSERAKILHFSVSSIPQGSCLEEVKESKQTLPVLDSNLLRECSVPLRAEKKEKRKKRKRTKEKKRKKKRRTRLDSKKK